MNIFTDEINHPMKFQISIMFELGSDYFYNLNTFKNWLFNIKYGIIKKYSGKDVFWPHFAIRIC